MRLPRGAGPALLAAAVVLVMVAWRTLAGAPEPPRADALRYLDYATNLVEHGYFGLSEDAAPGRANTPLYPAFLAAVLGAEGVPPAALRCWLAQGEHCDPAVFRRVVDAQLALAALAVLAIAAIGWRLLGARGGWLAAGAALLSLQPTYFAGLLLTENLTIVLFALLGVLMLRPGREASRRRRFATGLVLGALALNRPEFAYLGYAFIAVAIGSAILHRTPLAALALAAGFALMLGPWMARNAMHFGDPALTATYGGVTLAQRVSYNRMSTAELAVAFVYWLPDFGDTLAEALFPRETWDKLDFGPGSYYQSARALHHEVAARAGGTDKVAGVLLREAVLGEPVKHAAVTLALAWRGVFVGKLWGLVGLFAFVAALARHPACRATLLRLSLPAWLMLGLYAAVSVSIPRYAVVFLPVFSLGWAALFVPRSPPVVLLR